MPSVKNTQCAFFYSFFFAMLCGLPLGSFIGAFVSFTLWVCSELVYWESLAVSFGNPKLSVRQRKKKKSNRTCPPFCFTGRVRRLKFLGGTVRNSEAMLGFFEGHTLRSPSVTESGFARKKKSVFAYEYMDVANLCRNLGCDWFRRTFEVLKEKFAEVRLFKQCCPIAAQLSPESKKNIYAIICCTF